MSNRPPLQGITVIALEHAIAAPLCTRQLADLGATVIKLERPGGGDFARGYDHRTRGQSSHFIWVNRGKKSLALDLKHARASEVMLRLLAAADVMVQNLAPGATRRLGLDFDSLHSRFPRLIVCDISGYGDGGPYQDRKAYDLLVQAEAGFLAVTGNAEQPAKAGISVADIAAGTQAHAAILAALLQREKTGTGSHISISMLESMVEWMGYPLNYAWDGQEGPPRSGMDHASIYPYGVFAAGDGSQVMLGLQNEREWPAFCDLVLEQPALARDPRFDNNSKRSQARAVLKAITEAVFSKLSGRQLRERLHSAGIAWADVNDMAAVWKHPQLLALQRFVPLETPNGSVRTLLPPGHNDSYEPVLAAVPAVGQHSRDVLASAGYTATEIDTLASAGAITVA